jgi:hypothetical protein
MAGRSRQGRAPTRRFHLPSAMRGSPAPIDAGTARELVANGALLVDVRRKGYATAHSARAKAQYKVVVADAAGDEFDAATAEGR